MKRSSDPVTRSMAPAADAVASDGLRVRLALRRRELALIAAEERLRAAIAEQDAANIAHDCAFADYLQARKECAQASP